MINLIHKIYQILNEVKGFENVGYSGKTAPNGYMMLDHNGKRYAVKLVEIKEPQVNPFKDLDQVQYYL